MMPQKCKNMNKISSSTHFADTYIEFIGLEEPVRSSAKVLLSLSPNPRILINIKDLPSEYMEYFTKATFHMETIPVRLASDQTIEVFFWLNNGLFSHFSEPVGVTLLPARSPLNIQKDNGRIHAVCFKMINFHNFYSTQDVHIVLKEGKWIEMTPEEMKIQRPVEIPCRRLGRVKLKAAPWLVEITAVDEITEIVKTLDKEEGFGITHKGSIRQENEEPFSVEDVESFLTALSLFLSFVRGCASGIPIITGFNTTGKCIWKQCRNPTVDSWKAYHRSWFDPMNGDALTDVFAGFWDYYQNSKQREMVRVALEWYLISNVQTATHAKIVLNQAALEKLSFAIVGAKSRLNTGKWIAKDIESSGIDLQIPVKCEALGNYRQQNGYDNGLHTLVKIRNDLVHSEMDHKGLPSDVQWQASQLGLWYVELLLLKLFDYNGKYGNRLTQEWRGEVEFVPWAQGRTSTSCPPSLMTT